MQLKSLRLAVIASMAISGMAFAQTAPADQNQTPNQPAPAAPADQPAATAAPAPEAAPAEGTRKKAEEEIVVTGSRVRRKDLTTPAPVTVINKEQIQASGIAAIGDFLQQMPETAGGENTNVNNGGDGQTTISLRDLGAQRTLVLVDGKRWVNGGSGAGTTVDLNSIPTAAIERVEVLKDGASAVYGSDPIGGVVNIITRRRVNGVELSAYGGVSGHGDAQQYDLSVTGGAAGEKGSFMFSAGYFDQRSLLAGNRDWAALAVADDLVGGGGAGILGAETPGTIVPGGSSRIPQGRAAIYYANFSNKSGGTYAGQSKTKLTSECAGDSFHGIDPDKGACAVLDDPGNYVRVCTTQLCNDLFGKYYKTDATTNAGACTYNSANGDKAPSGCSFTVDLGAAAGTQVHVVTTNVMPDLSYTHVGPVYTFGPGTGTGVDGWRKYGGADAYNYQDINMLITPSTRISLFSNGDYHIADFARAYFQGSFVNRQSQNLLAAEPLDTGTFGIPVDASNAYNPFGITLFDVRRRLVEYAGRAQGYDLDTIRAVAGIDGTLPEEFGPLQGVFWDINFNYGRTAGVTTTYGSLNVESTGAAIGPSNPDGTCVSNPSGLCTPANLFHLPIGGGFVPVTGDTLTPAMLAALGGYKGINQGWTQIAAAQANISAELFKIAAERPVGLAAGYEYRGYFGGNVPNAIAQSFLDTDYNGAPTEGSYHVNEGYAELDIPLVSNITGAEDLELQVAGRVFNYSTFGTDSTYKFGGRWRPVRDVTLRGTYSSGFRAPDISDLYGGQGPSAESATDPCANVGPNAALKQQCGGVANNNDTNVQINSTIGGNPKLQPEKANMATVGAVFEPQAVRGLTATLDYWNIQVTNLIGALTTQVILNGCYPASIGSSNAPIQSYCDLIQRDPNTGHISNVNDFNTNVGRIITSGFDFAVRYGIPTDFGRFAVLFDSTYLINYNYTVGEGISAHTYHAAGNYDSGSGGAFSNLTPKIKFNVGLNYSLAGFNAGVRGRFIGSFTECANAAGDTTGLNGPGFCSDHNTDANIGGTGVEYPNHSVSAYIAFDIFASYLLKSPFGNTTFSAGIRNLLDQNPPVVYNSFLTYADPGYDFVGRFVYGRITHNF
ncbi:MAG TPA: TonB-dependent receptor [Myxococcales bacterium]|nr:TonB-dependent receptor [Myxococcales bacterium]